MLAAGPFSDFIPDGMMERWLRGSIDVEGFAARVRITRIVEKRGKGTPDGV